MKYPIAVLISDIHFTVPNLEICTQALQLSIDKAKELTVPLIIAGDLNDSKAIIRGEVANRLIDTFIEAQNNDVRVVIIPGNHDLLSVKENSHSLNFLNPYVHLISTSETIHTSKTPDMYLIPYQISNEAFLIAIKDLQPNTIVIAHQGFKGANLGAYFKDDTSVDPEAVNHLRIISGHYHMHQDIGTVTYIGSPFTQTFSEANDGSKGFCVLYNDGSLEQIPTNLRKHILLECTTETVYNIIENYNQGDLVQIRVSGSKTELDKLDKKDLGLKLLGHQDFKLDKIYPQKLHKEYKNAKLDTSDLLDEIIDNLDESDMVKSDLKSLWKEIL